MPCVFRLSSALVEGFFSNELFDNANTQSKALSKMLEMHVYIKSNLRLLKKFFFLFETIKIDYNFVKFFGLGFGLDCSWSRNLPVSISVLVSEKLSDVDLGLDVYGLDYITDRGKIYYCLGPFEKLICPCCQQNRRL